jgi:7-keto-8-aminopelargonate synthetase-like enzyme
VKARRRKASKEKTAPNPLAGDLGAAIGAAAGAILGRALVVNPQMPQIMARLFAELQPLVAAVTSSLEVVQAAEAPNATEKEPFCAACTDAICAEKN